MYDLHEDIFVATTHLERHLLIALQISSSVVVS